MAALVSATAPAGCDGRDEIPPADAGADAGPVEGCVDIRVDGTILEDAEAWGEVPIQWARHPFWVDERGVHVVWVDQMIAGDDFLIVSSFDRETGDVLANRVYGVYPPDLAWANIWDADGSPDGSFAVVIGYADDTAPDGYIQLVALGHLDDEVPRALVPSPWAILDAELFHVGFDGEAFAVHAAHGAQVRLVRFAPDGTVVTPPTDVGVITSIWDESAALHTDAETGTTWMATSVVDGLWLSGHDRDGTLLPGTEANGGVVVSAQGQPQSSTAGLSPGVASDGPVGVVAWHSIRTPQGDTRLQPVLGATPSSDALLVVDPPTGSAKVLARWQDAWWMGMLRPSFGIDQYRIEADADGVLTGFVRSPLVTLSTCSPTCIGDHTVISVSKLAVVRWQDELWFGFRDSTAAYTAPEHSVAHNPYRVVRVKPGCSYRTMYDLEQDR